MSYVDYYDSESWDACLIGLLGISALCIHLSSKEVDIVITEKESKGSENDE